MTNMPTSQPFYPPDSRIALLMHDNLTDGAGKMGLGLLRYCETPIVAIVDRETAGQDSMKLTGIAPPVPIVATLEEAAARGANVLIPGIAPSGGALPADWWEEVKTGVSLGMSLINGLHAPLANHPELTPLLQPGRFIRDVRQEPSGLQNGMGRAIEVSARRVAFVGTDMAIGKMTAAIELERAARRRGLRARFLATGQTGICIAGDGVPLDGVRVDFASGAIEALVLRHGYDHDWLFIEGQGSLLHPASTAWLPILRGSCPTDLILSHRAGQTHISRAEAIPIPPLPIVIALYEAVCAAGSAFPAAKVAGIALNCSELDENAARAAIAQTEAETGLPVTDVVRFGAEPLLESLLA